jgi:hypothetical protein
MDRIKVKGLLPMETIKVSTQTPLLHSLFLVVLFSEKLWKGELVGSRNKSG